MPAALPLEDTFGDIIGKAVRGLGLSPSQVAEKAGVSRAEVQAALEGTFAPAVVEKVAAVLGLNSPALLAAGRREWAPEPVEVPGLAQFNTEFEDMTVNAYVLWDPLTRAALIFDTGGDASPLLEAIAREQLRPELILLTHTHGDHVFELDRVKEKTGAPAWVGEREPLEGARPFAAGQTFSAGGLRVETRLTSGHSKGGITYVVHGLARPVAVVGDAVFAGSMGGGMVSYADALRTNRAEILTLPEATVLCPGHGPLTTVGEEKRHNPFLATGAGSF